MPTIYTHKKNTVHQETTASSAMSILNHSSQSEGLQRKADMANNAAQRAEAPRPNNTGMPDNLKAGIESLSGFSMDDVRVHYNSSKPATVQALAYTQGTDIHVAPGQEKHLPHEAWHVAQQMAGRVSPTTNINGMPVNDNAALEHEADVMGEKAVQCKMDIGKLTKQCNAFQNTILQRKTDHLFNDIPKTISSLTINQNGEDLDLIKSVRQEDGPNIYQTLNDDIYKHYKELNELRNAFTKEDVHAPGVTDKNNDAFSNASNSLKENFKKRRTDLIKKSADDLWKSSIDPDVERKFKEEEEKKEKEKGKGRGKGKGKESIDGKITDWKNHSDPVAKALCRIAAGLKQNSKLEYINKGTI
jgi:hypothetical protein